MRNILIGAAIAIGLGGCQTPAPRPVASSAPMPAVAPAETAPRTRILNPVAADRLMNNKGVTLQWIGWDHRGSARVADDNGVWRLSAAQDQQDGPGKLRLDGTIREIGSDYFLFDGTISITDTPDKGRDCRKQAQWRFAVTQNRPYWRARHFAWCDGLTDYVDIYF